MIKIKAAARDRKTHDVQRNEDKKGRLILRKCTPAQSRISLKYRKKKTL